MRVRAVVRQGDAPLLKQLAREVRGRKLAAREGTEKLSDDFDIVVHKPVETRPVGRHRLRVKRVGRVEVALDEEDRTLRALLGARNRRRVADIYRLDVRVEDEVGKIGDAPVREAAVLCGYLREDIVAEGIAVTKSHGPERLAVRREFQREGTEILRDVLLLDEIGVGDSLRLALHAEPVEPAESVRHISVVGERSRVTACHSAREWRFTVDRDDSAAACHDEVGAGEVVRVSRADDAADI